MRDAMAHGGPDDAGIYLDAEKGLALGHRRLSIIDLSSGGHQPMQREHVILAFNGEIYNFRALRQELLVLGQSFSTDSDTEVIIRAYQQWGTSCFGRFRGMFAIALYDLKDHKLILGRDHAGIKPLYYYLSGNKLYFASEVRAFRRLGYWGEHPDWQIYLLTYGFLPEPITTLREVKPLEKGSFLEIDLHSFTCRHQYFYREHFTEEIHDLQDATHAIRASLTAAVRSHLISDAPIGLFLSGGIDSSLLTLLAQPFVPNDLHTLSLVFQDQQFSEEAYQQVIIQKTGARHQAFCVTKKDFDDSFDDIMQAMDQPSTDGINSYFICKYARRAGLKAVLSGLGGDELFGGYPSFKRSRHYHKFRNLPAWLLGSAAHIPRDKYRKLNFLERMDSVGEYLFYRGYYTPRETGNLLGCSEGHVKEVLSAASIPNSVSELAPGNRVSWLESNLYMQSQLLKDTDCMSMWHAVEVRVPFLDRDLMELAHKISPSLKFDQAQDKYLLIESFKDLLPREIWDRKKQGFVLPFAAWMKGKALPVQVAPGPTVKTLHQRFNQNQLAWSRYWAYLITQTAQFSSNETNHGSELIDMQKPRKKVLFLNLSGFRFSGGIETFNRCFMKALWELEQEGVLMSQAISAYDQTSIDDYFPSAKYTGFGGKRLRFLLHALYAARSFDIIVLGHINLAPVGVLLKKLYPEKQLMLIAHGIEVWQPLTGMKHKLLSACDLLFSVSRYTFDKLVTEQGVDPGKITIFPNTVNPYFPWPSRLEKDYRRRERLGIAADSPVLLTLSRLAASEQYKGYDLVLRSLPELKKTYPNIRYIIAGKYDAAEKQRIDTLIAELKLEENVILTGYVPDGELVSYYQAADVFVMPSRNEGFGIVFLEAMLCGLPVIAGNLDGSVDALRDGELGLLVDPTRVESIREGIATMLTSMPTRRLADAAEIQKKVIVYFGFKQYMNRLRAIFDGNPENPFVEMPVKDTVEV